MSNHGPLKIRILANKKGESICLDPPHQPDIKIEYLKNFSGLISTELYWIICNFEDVFDDRLFDVIFTC